MTRCVTIYWVQTVVVAVNLQCLQCSRHVLHRLPIVHLFMLFFFVVGHAARSNVVVRLWLGVEGWNSYLRVWPWLVLFTFQVRAQGIKIIFGWRRWEIRFRAECWMACLYKPYPLKKYRRQEKNQKYIRWEHKVILVCRCLLLILLLTFSSTSCLIPFICCCFEILLVFKHIYICMYINCK